MAKLLQVIDDAVHFLGKVLGRGQWSLSRNGFATPCLQAQQQLRCFGPQHSFKRWGKSGQEISDLLPEIGSIAGEICIIRSMQTEQIYHDPAHTFMSTGTQISGRPSAGSWIWYGIGAEAEE